MLGLPGLDVDWRLRLASLTELVPVCRAQVPSLVIPVRTTTTSHPPNQELEAEQGENEMINEADQSLMFTIAIAVSCSIKNRKGKKDQQK